MVSKPAGDTDVEVRSGCSRLLKSLACICLVFFVDSLTALLILIPMLVKHCGILEENGDLVF